MLDHIILTVSEASNTRLPSTPQPLLRSASPSAWTMTGRMGARRSRPQGFREERPLHHAGASDPPPRWRRLRGDDRNRPGPDDRRPRGRLTHDRPHLCRTRAEPGRRLHAVFGLRRSQDQRNRRHAELGGQLLFPAYRVRVDGLSPEFGCRCVRVDLRSLPVPGSGTGVRERAKTAKAHCACHDLKSRQPKGFCCKNSEWLEDAFLCPSYAVLTWRLCASIVTTSASALGRPRRPVQRYAATHRMSASRPASTDSRCGSSGNWVSQKRGRNRHEQSLHHDVRDLTAPHCPTDDATGIEIDDDRQIGKPSQVRI